MVTIRFNLEVSQLQNLLRKLNVHAGTNVANYRLFPVVDGTQLSVKKML
jgi:hypothetical protein